MLRLLLLIIIMIIIIIYINNIIVFLAIIGRKSPLLDKNWCRWAEERWGKERWRATALWMASNCPPTGLARNSGWLASLAHCHVVRGHWRDRGDWCHWTRALGVLAVGLLPVLATQGLDAEAVEVIWAHGLAAGVEHRGPLLEPGQELEWSLVGLEEVLWASVATERVLDTGHPHGHVALGEELTGRDGLLALFLEVLEHLVVLCAPGVTHVGCLAVVGHSLDQTGLDAPGVLWC